MIDAGSGFLPKTPYERGRAAEYAVKRILEARGFRWILRSAASHSPLDLLASNGTEILGVQVKGSSTPYVSKLAKEELIQWAERFKAKPVIARKKRGRWRLEEV